MWDQPFALIRRKLGQNSILLFTRLVAHPKDLDARRRARITLALSLVFPIGHKRECEYGLVYARTRQTR